jgi:hypothetical protein
MTTKQAIAWCEKTLGKGDWPEVFIIIAALAESQKHERKMFKALRPKCCEGINGWCGMRFCECKCARRNCPLLKPVEKPFSDCKKKGKK